MHEILKALAGFGKADSTKEAAKALLNALGYESERTANIGGGVRELVERLDKANEHKSLTDRQRKLFNPWRSTDIVFQITEEEIHEQPGLSLEFQSGWIKSFLFLVADLEEGRSYSRTELAEMTRIINRLPMSVIVLFRHEKSLTLSAVHRRVHKRDSNRDVLERVSLVKNINFANPHRAHIDILANLELRKLTGEGAKSFDELQEGWESVLDIKELNKRFYRELFDWFQRAIGDSHFPSDSAEGESAERHVIQLITRLLFIWFMREKGLVPKELFEESFANEALKGYRPDGSDYYCAILQNLFFATLNSEIGKRTFGEKDDPMHLDSGKFQHHDLLTDPTGLVKILKQVPFVNGGLFEDSDASAIQQDELSTNQGISQRREGLNVPARLFFDDHGLFPLLRRYKFTVEENTPLDQEVALDPELLGLVFENLLAAHNPETRETARRKSGSYYTPGEVVDYMVQETLVDTLVAKAVPADGDSSFWRERLEFLLDHSDAMTSAKEIFEKEESQALVNAIADIRVLDPAVGSGAFPMAILQVLTMALRRIDPDNSLWENAQKERAKARAQTAFDSEDKRQRDDALLDISSTFEKYKSSDFGRKLYLIQNGIYGVDIQPIACQISKLRFFISLLVEQETNTNPADNYGIHPLPNLETRFIAADTLKKLKAQEVLREVEASRIKSHLQRIRERHFNARTPEYKLKLRLKDQAYRAELASKLGPNFGHDSAQTIANWDLYDQNTSSDWFDPEWMFGVDDGFDVVIGNPPYIQLQKDGGRLANEYQGEGYDTFARSGDIYQLFFERGCNLLKPKTGVLAYITSNSWLKAKYGKLLRRWLSDLHTPLRLIEMGKDVFGAVVDTSILMVREGGHTTTLPAIDMDHRDDKAFPPTEKEWHKTRLVGDTPWRILSEIEWMILDKMNGKGVPLKDWEVHMNRGITTGYNDAFIIDDATRTALIEADPRANEIIKPVFRGKDIQRWRARWAEKWLIYCHSGIAEFEYPFVREHLLVHMERLLERSGVNYGWWQLQADYYRSGAYQDFAKEKLLWPDMSREGRFAYSDTEIYCNDAGFIMTGSSLKYLCAMLNSSLVAWMKEETAVTTGAGLSRWKKFFVESLPIPKVSAEKQRPFIQIVDRILEKKDAGSNADVRNLEAEIDRLVFELYDLTAEEIAVIRKAIE